MGRRIAAAILVASGLCAPAGAQQLCRPWQWANPLPQGNNLTGVAYGNGVYVAVGVIGTVLASRDAATWTVVPIGTTADLSAVSWDGRQFVAVGASGTVALSPYGFQWSVNSVGSSEILAGAASDGGRLVVVGASGAIFWSLDGTMWQRAASATTSDLMAVSWTGTRFVAAERGGVVFPGAVTPVVGILSSPDGVAWTRTPVPDAMSFQAFASSGSRLLLIGAYCVVPFASPGGWCDSGALVVVSDDGGVSWSSTKLPGVWAFADVVWTGSRFLAVQGDSVLQSPDGLSWTSAGGGPAIWWPAIAIGDSGLVAVGMSGCISTSADGASWTPVLSNAYRPDLADVVWTGTRFVAVGPGSYAFPAAVKVSPDGLTWTDVDAEPLRSRYGLNAVASSGSTLVAVGDTYIARSVDGLTWSVVANWDIVPYFRLVSVAWTGTRFIAVGSRPSPVWGFDGFAVGSSDGSIWTEVQTQPGVSLWGIAGHGGTAVVTGFDAGDNFKLHIYVATGLDQWQEVAGLSLGSVGPVAWIDSEFLLLGGSPPRSYASSDGLSWTEVGHDVPDGLYRMAWDGREIVGVGNYGMTARSADGSTWCMQSAGTWYRLAGVAAGFGRVVAVGQASTVLWQESDQVQRLRRRLTRSRPE